MTLAGCSGGPAVTDPADITGETFGDGNISALVPDGWMGFHGTDYFEEYEEGYDPNVIQIAKGAKSEWDLLSTPYVMISYFGPDNPMMEPMKELYEESADIEPVTIGDYTQVMICLENGDKISLEDADVQAIIASINISK